MRTQVHDQLIRSEVKNKLKLSNRQGAYFQSEVPKVETSFVLKKDKESLRQAIILKEILDQPKALKKHRF